MKLSSNIVLQHFSSSFFVAVMLSCVGVVTSAAAAGSGDAPLAVKPRVDELIVTGIRQGRLAELPRSAHVITAEDIALSPSTNIVELISREANVQLRGFSGNEKTSGVDIRGQGDTYASNVLVLVDGIRLNSADQSGADYSTLPLDQVERIEVIRGANSVRYGGGAVGGVINIITRRAETGVEQGVKANARLRGGSYATVDAGTGASWAGEQFSLAADIAYFDTDGYRDNGSLEKTDISARIGFDPVDWFGLALGAFSHRDEYGLPGPVTSTKYNDGSDADRRSTETPDSGGKTDDDRLRLDLQLGTEGTGELRMSGQTRDRENPFVLSDTAAVINEDRQAFDGQYTKDFAWLSRSHAFYLGADTTDVEYSRENTTDPDKTKRGDIRQQAWFAALDIGLSDTLKFSTGYRQDSFKVKGHEKLVPQICPPVPGPFPPPCPDIIEVQSDSWRNSAAEAGLVYSPATNSNWFLSFSQSFRNPNVDDLVVSDGDLQPQSANNWDVGVRQYWNDVLEMSFSLFYSKTKNEILYGRDPVSGQLTNRNAEQPTERTGGELSARWYLLSSLTLTGNAGYTDAEFTETNTDIPMVPKWTAGLGIQWSFLEDFVWDTTGSYVGERYDGLDLTNTKPKVDSYAVVDTKLSYELKNMQLYVGINNFFDEIYSPSVYLQTYYPMPDRNYYAGLTYRLDN